MKAPRWILKYFGFANRHGRLPELYVDISNGFADLRLHMLKPRRRRDGAFCFTALSNYRGRTVGFSLEIDGEVRPQQLDGSNLVVYWGTGYFVPLQNETHEFIRVLSELYAVEVRGSRDSRLPIQLVGIGDDPRRLLEQPVRMKVFFNPMSEDDSLYSEVYINTDIDNRAVEFHEKDIEYRQSLLNSLSGFGE